MKIYVAFTIFLQKKCVFRFWEIKNDSTEFFYEMKIVRRHRRKQFHEKLVFQKEKNGIVHAYILNLDTNGCSCSLQYSDTLLQFLCLTSLMLLNLDS